MRSARLLVRRCLTAIDLVYHRLHRLRRVGPMLLIGQTRYRGPSRSFPGGTTLKPGDLLGTIHFDNASIAALETGTPAATGLKFARQLLRSLRSLGELVARDEAFRDVTVFQGIGWIRHGAEVGFIHEPHPPGYRQRFLAWYLRLLVWAFAAEERTAELSRPEVTVSWLTRDVLVTRFAREGSRG